MENSPSALVIEDDADVAALLGSHLRRLGWRVTLAGSAEEALERVRREPAPDVAVVDLLLPGMDGRELVQQLRDQESTRGCRIVVTSVLDRDEQQALAPDAVLPKPFTRNDVLRAMSGLAPRDAS